MLGAAIVITLNVHSTLTTQDSPITE